MTVRRNRPINSPYVGNLKFSVTQDPGSSEDNYVLTYDDATGEISLEAAGAGATQLSDLSDVTSAGVTNRFALMADGAAYVGRALVEADISDLGTYLSNIVEDTTPQLGGTLDAQSNDITTVANLTMDGSLTIQDSTNADAVVMSHDGTDFNFVFTNTAEAAFSGATRMEIRGGMDLWIRDGGFLRVSDSLDGDYMTFSHNGTNGIWSHVNTGWIIWQNLTEGVQIDDGSKFRQLGPTSTGYVDHSHDDTDFNTAFTSTTDWNITGLTALKAGNYHFNVDQTVGAGQDNYVLTYDNATGEIGLEAAAAGGISNVVEDVTPQLGADLDTNTFNIDFQDNDAAVFGTGSDVTMQWDGVDFEITGAAGSQVWNFRDGPHLRIYDDTDTDYAEFQHDGTDFNTSFTTTTDWNIDSANTGTHTLQYANWDYINIRDGGVFRVYDSTDQDLIQIRHTATAAEITTAGTSNGPVDLTINDHFVVRESLIGTGDTSACTVEDHAGTAHDVGFNVLPVQEDNPASVTLGAQHCGQVIFADDGTSFTVTVEGSGTTDFPVGGVTTVINAAGGSAITIADNSTTLYLLDGSARTDVGANCTLAVGGVATIWREAAGVYYVWGSGLTA